MTKSQNHSQLATLPHPPLPHHKMRLPRTGTKGQLTPVFPVAQRVKNLPAMRETQDRSLGGEDPLEQRMAIHSSNLAWRIPQTKEPGGLQSVGSQSQTRLSDEPHTPPPSPWVALSFLARSHKASRTHRSPLQPAPTIQILCYSFSLTPGLCLLNTCHSVLRVIISLLFLFPTEL